MKVKTRDGRQTLEFSLSVLSNNVGLSNIPEESNIVVVLLSPLKYYPPSCPQLGAGDNFNESIPHTAQRLLLGFSAYCF